MSTTGSLWMLACQTYDVVSLTWYDNDVRLVAHPLVPVLLWDYHHPVLGRHDDIVSMSVFLKSGVWNSARISLVRRLHPPVSSLQSADCDHLSSSSLSDGLVSLSIILRPLSLHVCDLNNSSFLNNQLSSPSPVPNPGPKSKSQIQSPEERDWDWGWH